MIDFNLEEGTPIKNNDRDLLLQQIDLLFDTKPKSVIGDKNYGTSYENYLYNLELSAEGIKNIVISDLNSLDLLGYYPEVEAYILQGTENDIILIDITLTGKGETYNRTYKIV